MRIRAVESVSRTLIAALAALVASCGGGGSDSEQVPKDIARLDCEVSDSISRKPVADAAVTFQSGQSALGTQTDSDGRCGLDLPAAEVAGVEYPAFSVTKPGYEPQTLICASLQGGKTCSQNVDLIPLAANVSIPVGGDQVMHLGDDQFDGLANSQFQKASDGLELVFPIADWADKVKAAGVTTATVYLDAKGWQTNECTNQITLVGDGGTQVLRGGVSPSGGYWAGGRQVPFVFSVARIGLLRGELRVTSGTCNGTSDFDDFEINRIRVEFN